MDQKLDLKWAMDRLETLLYEKESSRYGKRSLLCGSESTTCGVAEAECLLGVSTMRTTTMVKITSTRWADRTWRLPTPITST
jgi:hypothetical protein